MKLFVETDADSRLAKRVMKVIKVFILFYYLNGNNFSIELILTRVFTGLILVLVVVTDPKNLQ